MMNSQTARTTPLTPKHHRPKVMGEGRLVPLDRNAKARIKVFAKVLSHPTEKRKHWGVLTAKFLDVLDALIWGFHNAVTGRCFPRYEKIAEWAHCHRDTVYEAIHALEKAGILTWVNRYIRTRGCSGVDLFGKPATKPWLVRRTSNQYELIDPKAKAKPPDPHKSELPTGTLNQVSFLLVPPAPKPALDPANSLHGALLRLGAVVQGTK